MMLKRLTRLRRSMFGQMLVLSLVFLVGVVYYIAIYPIVGVEVVSPDPLDYTVEKARQELRGFIDSRLDSDQGDAPFQLSAELTKIVEKNPGFQYFIKVKGRTYRNVDAPRFYDTYQLSALSAQIEKTGLNNICATYYEALDSAEGEGYVQYNHCSGRPYYLEFYGLTSPVIPPTTSYLDYYQRHLWDGGRYLVLSALGVLVITVLILMYNLRAMKRLASLAYSFDPRKLHQKLPEDGLPNEVLPLVQAVNNMIARVDETQQQHNFFLSTAAHEMRTPLTVLRTRLEMLDEGRVKDKLVNDVRRLTSLVNQLLRLMRIGGPKSLDSEVDVVQCCERVVRERRSFALEQNVHLQFDSDVPCYIITGDAGLLEVAIANLVDNAVSFSKPGDSVRLALYMSGNLVVTDSGPGIPQDKLNALFEPFAKFPPNRNGHGLGLAIVKAIAVLHEARISAANRAGGGAEFTLSFSDRADI